MQAHSDFHALSSGIADIIAAVSPSLFQVVGRRGGTAVVTTHPGRAVTATHVVGPRERVHLRPVGAAGHVDLIEAELIGRDRATDLALLKLAVPVAVAPTWADDETLRVGELALALGRPGSGVASALGQIARLGGPWWTPHGAPIDRYIDVDGRLPDGYSGGPLVRADGTLLGMNTHAHLPGGAVLPTRTVLRIAEALEAHGRVRRGQLGVTVQPGTVRAADQTWSGLLVTDVRADGPAASAGVQTGDLLLEVDGRATTHPVHLLGALTGRVDQPTAIRVLRGGAAVELMATPTEAPSSVSESPAAEESNCATASRWLRASCRRGS
ncbi:MAG: trypsin-like peptidase domain-containing protein [Myxococcales bacterium]|nr:trypsin-like peptidase domain-containing protein [Myxococcales bacterium]